MQKQIDKIKLRLIKYLVSLPSSASGNETLLATEGIVVLEMLEATAESKFRTNKKNPYDYTSNGFN